MDNDLLSSDILDLHSYLRWNSISKYIVDVPMTLDVGCNAGTMTLEIAKRTSGKVLGIEMDPALVIKARERALAQHVSNCEFMEGNALHLPFPNETFDQILLADVLEHVLYDYIVIRECFRVMKSGGRLIINAPRPNYPTLFNAEWIKSIGHVRDGYELEDIKDLTKNFFDVTAYDFNSRAAEDLDAFYNKGPKEINIDRIRKLLVEENDESKEPFGLSVLLERKETANTGKTALRVLHVGWGHPPYMAAGPIYYVHHLALEQTRDDTDVACFVAGSNKEDGNPDLHLSRLNIDGIQYFVVNGRPVNYFDWSNPRREMNNDEVNALFEEVLIDWRPDVVHFHNVVGLSISLPIVAKSHGLCTVFSLHNYFMACPKDDLFGTNEQPCEGPGDGARCASCIGNPAHFKEFMERNSLSIKVLNDYCDEVLAVSEKVKSLFLNFGVRKEIIRTQHIGSVAAEENWIKLRKGGVVNRVKEGPLHFAFLGTLSARKGVHTIIEAVRLLKAYEGMFVVNIFGAGDDSYRNRLELSINSDEFVQRAVSLKGGYLQSSLPDLLRTIDVAIIPPIWEDNGPQTVMETLGAGVPVIGSRIGGIPDFVTDGKNGLLFKPGDARDLALAIEKVINDTTLLPSLGVGIEPPLTMESHVADLRRVYSELTKQNVRFQLASPNQGTPLSHSAWIDSDYTPVEECLACHLGLEESSPAHTHSARDNAAMRIEQSRFLPMPVVEEFDEKSYLLFHEDVWNGIGAGKWSSGWDHFVKYGFAQGRPWFRRSESAEVGRPLYYINVFPPVDDFNEEGYLRAHADVARGIEKGECRSGWDHFIRYGALERRKWFRRKDSKFAKVLVGKTVSNREVDKLMADVATARPVGTRGAGDTDAVVHEDTVSCNPDYPVTSSLGLKGRRVEMLESAEALITGGDLKEAEIVLSRLVSEDSLDISALNDLAVVKILTSKPVDAVRLMKRVLRIDPLNKIASDNLAALDKEYSRIIDDIVMMEDFTADELLTEAEIEKSFKALGDWFTKFKFNGKTYGGEKSYVGDPRVKDFLIWFSQGGSVLEIGSFEGSHSLRLVQSPRIDSVFGLEGRDFLVQRSKLIKAISGSEKMNFVQCDLETEDISSFGRFDAAFCAGVLFLLSRPWQMIEKVAAVTDNLFISTHYARTARESVEGFEGEYHKNGSFSDPLGGLSERSFWLTFESLAKALQKNGFQIINVQHFNDWGGYPMVDLFCSKTNPVNDDPSITSSETAMHGQLGFDGGHGSVTVSPTEDRESLHAHGNLRPNSAIEIIREIAPDDEMYDGKLEHYFGVGESAMRCIDSALFNAGREKRSVRRILDLPSGHGRVMRSFRAAFPNAELTACDLNRSGVDFCAKTFGAVPVYSEIDVNRIRLQGKFDLIWSGSLLTHLSEEHCREFIRLFDSVLDVGGIMMFTTHGRRTEDWMTGGHWNYGLSANQIDELLTSYYQNGFGYVDYSDKNPGYGISICTPSFVLTDL